jgi:HK97 family phage major capsid protein
MPISLVDVLRQSIDELHGRMNAIEAGAVADQRDTLNDVEQATWDELRAEAEAKTGRLELLVSRGELDAQAGELMARMRGGAPPSSDSEPVGGSAPFPYRTPGEYVMGYMRMKHGDAGEAARFTRALADVTTAQTPGLVPPQVTGDILGEWLAARPAVDAMTKPPLPPVGMKIQRPHIAQHVDVGPHAEKAAVTSQAFHLDLAELDLASYAGAVDVAWELVERSSPSALDVIFRDLVRVYARRSETGAWDHVAVNIAANQVAWDGTAATLAKAMADAAVFVATNSEESVWPDTVWLGTAAYGALAALVDAGGRPLFPYLNALNAYGTADAAGTISTVMGLRPVVATQIPPNTFTVGNSEEVEFYETPGAPVQLSVVDVGVAGYNVGVIGMFACAAVDTGAFVNVGPITGAGTEETGNGPGAARASRSKDAA